MLNFRQRYTNICIYIKTIEAQQVDVKTASYPLQDGCMLVSSGGQEFPVLNHKPALMRAHSWLDFPPQGIDGLFGRV